MIDLLGVESICYTVVGEDVIESAPETPTMTGSYSLSYDQQKGRFATVVSWNMLILRSQK